VAAAKAGKTLDRAEIARLVGEAGAADRVEAQRLAAEVGGLQDALSRRLQTGSRTGAVERQRLRQDLDGLNGLIENLERGGAVDLAQFDAIMGSDLSRAPLSARDRVAASRVELATQERRLITGGRLGAVDRVKIHDEIDRLEAMISNLEKASR
jgi:hypothetical protein